jgi:hypothetical protein
VTVEAVYSDDAAKFVIKYANVKKGKTLLDSGTVRCDETFESEAVVVIAEDIAFRALDIFIDRQRQQ